MNSIKKQYAIDGLFLTQQMTGIQKYALKMAEGIDIRSAKGEFDIVVPEWVEEVPDYKNLNVVRFGKRKGIQWEQLDYPGYLKKTGKLALCMTNNPPVQYPRGVITLHDICCKTRPEYFTTLRDKLSAAWHSYLYRVAAKSDMTIVTDSEFSKKEIVSTYHIPEERVKVIYIAG